MWFVEGVKIISTQTNCDQSPHYANGVIDSLQNIDYPGGDQTYPMQGSQIAMVMSDSLRDKEVANAVLTIRILNAGNEIDRISLCLNVQIKDQANNYVRSQGCNRVTWMASPDTPDADAVNLIDDSGEINEIKVTFIIQNGGVSLG